jgi:predicted DCC family thiol-disulfide oxidoreductase YuxK
MPAKLYYERQCRFCRRMAWWVYRRSPPGSLQLVATDYTDLAQLPLPVYSAFFVREGKVYALSDAVIEALAHARCGWLGGAFAPYTATRAGLALPTSSGPPLLRPGHLPTQTPVTLPLPP